MRKKHEDYSRELLDDTIEGFLRQNKSINGADSTSQYDGCRFSSISETVVDGPMIGKSQYSETVQSEYKLDDSAIEVSDNLPSLMASSAKMTENDYSRQVS